MSNTLKEESLLQSKPLSSYKLNHNFTYYFFSELRDILEGIYNETLNSKEEKLQKRKELTDKINYTEQQLLIVTQVSFAMSFSSFMT